MKAGLENRLSTLEKATAFDGHRHFMFANDFAEAQTKLAALTPFERHHVVMVHWLPVQESPSAEPAALDP